MLTSIRIIFELSNPIQMILFSKLIECIDNDLRINLFMFYFFAKNIFVWNSLKLLILVSNNYIGFGHGWWKWFVKHFASNTDKV